LYEEKHYRRSTDDVTELISSLVELFPASQALQQNLCQTEAYTIGANESLPVFREIAAEQDKFLEAALAKVDGNAQESHSIVLIGDKNVGFQLGHKCRYISRFTFGKGS
jgi:cob(I)alamin adenosyltransferase